MNAIKLSKRRKEVMKHSSAVQITNTITLLQRRAWNVLLAKAFDEFDKTDRHQIRVRELVEMLDYKSHDDLYLKEALEKLTTTAVKWNILGKDKSCEWGVLPLLSGAVIRQGVLTYAFSPMLKERLHNPRMYARISLSMQNKFQSKHALALYELCLDYYDLERSYGETPYIHISEFRELMGVDDDEYPNFARLNDKVIKRAIQEINHVSDLSVTVKMQRNKRKIEELKFCVFRRNELSLPFSAMPTNVANATPPADNQRANNEIGDSQQDFDALFNAATIQKQYEILQTAFNALPDFVKQYEQSDDVATYETVFKPLLIQKRNEILQQMMVQ